MDLTSRHPGTVNVARHLAADTLPEELQAIAVPYERLAEEILNQLPDTPELTVAFRKLVESRDAALRAARDLP